MECCRYFRLAVLVALQMAGFVTFAGYADQYLNTPELVTKYGYPAEIHTVITADGYVLTVHRIPYSPKSPLAANRPVAFLQHGFLSSSADWIILGPNKSLGYLLADAGYDVWMGNIRGNTYSRKHITLSTNSYKYWNFSWHEMGMYDLPAMTDYVLNHTGQHHLSYVGISMGCTIFFVWISMKPEYNKKISLMVALAPVVFMANSTTPIKQLTVSNKPLLQFLSSIKMKNILSRGELSNVLADELCSDKQTRILCSNFLFNMAGFDAKQLNESLLPIFLYHLPAGGSWKSLMHYLQQMISGKFLQYDYGEHNMATYNQQTPPEYNLKAVSAPIGLFYGLNDLLADPTDVLKLSKTLSNVSELYRVQWDKFNHIDFAWANDVKSLVNDKVLNLMKRFKTQ